MICGKVFLSTFNSSFRSGSYNAYNADDHAPRKDRPETIEGRAMPNAWPICPVSQNRNALMK